MGETRASRPRSTPKHYPEGWGPDWFLEWRAAHLEIPIHAQYTLWANQWGTTRDAITAELRIWKKTEPGFRDKLLALDPRSSHDLGPALVIDDTDGAWRERFCSFYRIHHNRKKAAEEAGLPWETIRKRLWQHPNNPEYDDLIWEMCREIEAETAELARAGVKTAIEIAAEEGDARTLGKLSLDVLERREPRDWGRNQNIFVEATVLHAPLQQRQAALGRALQVSRVVVEQEAAALRAEAEGIEIVDAEVVDQNAEHQGRRELLVRTLGDETVSAIEGAIGQVVEMDDVISIFKAALNKPPSGGVN